jgi:hypothetical protein
LAHSSGKDTRSVGVPIGKVPSGPRAVTALRSTWTPSLSSSARAGSPASSQMAATHSANNGRHARRDVRRMRRSHLGKEGVARTIGPHSAWREAARALRQFGP